MSMTATCPQCQTRIEVPGDLADQPIQCHRCLTVFERGKAVASVAIQAGLAPAVPRDRDPEPLPSLPHREARAPFPVVSMFLLLVGILIFLLIASVGFNVYMMVMPEAGFRFNQRVLDAEAVAKQQRDIAQQAQQAAELNKRQGDLMQARLQKQIEELRRERDEAQEKLAEARRLLAK